MTPPPLAYAVPDNALAQYQWTRRVVAWIAIGYAASLFLNGGLFAFSIFQSPSPTWSYSIYQLAAIPLSIPMGIGGALLRQGRDAGAMTIRVTAILLCVTALVANIFVRMAFSMPAGSTIGSFGNIAMGIAVGVIAMLFSTPAVLFYLSFPLRRDARWTTTRAGE